jgi:hypothetical protein
MPSCLIHAPAGQSLARAAVCQVKGPCTGHACLHTPTAIDFGWPGSLGSGGEQGGDDPKAIDRVLAPPAHRETRARLPSRWPLGVPDPTVSTSLLNFLCSTGTFIPYRLAALPHSSGKPSCLTVRHSSAPNDLVRKALGTRCRYPLPLGVNRGRGSWNTLPAHLASSPSS